MLHSLKIFHFDHGKKDQNLCSVTAKYLESKNFSVWKTCLRTIVIGHIDGELKASLKNRGEYFEAEKAYQFLLELICGLHSKMIGETEIISQFKQFIRKHPHALHRKLSDGLIRDSKSIRNKHLTNYGGQSYGSYAFKKSSDCEQVVILGAGALTQDILPIFSSFAGKIFVQTRCPKKYAYLAHKHDNITLQRHPELPAQKDIKKTLIIIAAPITSQTLEKKIVTTYDQAYVLDMRSHRDGPPLDLPKHFQYESLETIFKNLEQVQFKLKTRVPAIKSDIHSFTRKWDNFIMHRPYGWEDLCF